MLSPSQCQKPTAQKKKEQSRKENKRPWLSSSHQTHVIDANKTARLRTYDVSVQSVVLTVKKYDFHSLRTTNTHDFGYLVDIFVTFFLEFFLTFHVIAVKRFFHQNLGTGVVGCQRRTTFFGMTEKSRNTQAK